MTESNKMTYNNRNKKLESKEDFINEYRSLILDVENSISNLEHFHKTNMSEPTLELIEDLNRLKLSRKKLLNLLVLYSDADHSKWMEIRPEARSIFKEAVENWHRQSEVFSKAA